MSDNPNRQHRSIAPNDTRRSPNVPPTGSVIIEQRDPRTAKPKRAVVHVACLACRKLRIKCDGQRPLCTPCLKRDEPCEYDVEANTTRTNALKRRNENLECELEQYKELYRAIRQRPEYEAAELFRRVRVTEDPLEVLRQLTAANLLIDGVRRINSQDAQDESMSDSHDEGKDKDNDSEEPALNGFEGSMSKGKADGGPL